MPVEEIPSNGYTLHYTVLAAHVVNGPNADLPGSGATLPSYPIASNDADWLRLKELSDLTGLESAERETVPYTIVDPERTVNEEFPTGRTNLGSFTFRVAYTQEKYTALKALRDNRTKARWLATDPLRPGQATPSRHATRGIVTVANPMRDAGGGPMMIDVTVTKTDDIPTFHAGADS